MASVTVTFGNDTKQDGAITPAWIRSAMAAQEMAGQPICGTVTVTGGEIHVTLPIGNCAQSGGGGRPPRAAEQEVLDIYRRLHLDQKRISPGELEAFVKQVGKL